MAQYEVRYWEHTSEEQLVLRTEIISAFTVGGRDGDLFLLGPPPTGRVLLAFAKDIWVSARRLPNSTPSEEETE